MAAPSNPTLTEIATEGLKKAGVRNPSQDQLDRAEDKWIEEIKNDIFHRSKKLKRLQITTYGIINTGQSRYANPTDFSSDLELTLLDGSETGTAQGGTLSSMTLAATATSSDIVGLYIIVTSGTAQSSASQITAYNSSTKVATVSPEFRVSPDSTSVYMVITNETPLQQKPLMQYTDFNQVTKGEPSYWFPMGDEDYGEFVLDRPPEKTYGARYRYYADITRLDLSSDHMSNLYRIWRNIFIQGIVAKKLQDADDNRASDEFLKYQRQLNNLITTETYGTDLSGLTEHVQNYM